MRIASLLWRELMSYMLCFGLWTWGYTLFLAINPDLARPDVVMAAAVLMKVSLVAFVLGKTLRLAIGRTAQAIS
jgi:hypothetical protein